MEFRTADHSACLREGQIAVRKRVQLWVEEEFSAAMEGALILHARHLQRAAKTGACMTVQPSTVNGTELGAQEWHDALFLWYGLEPPDLSMYCDGCQAKFSISHALDFKNGGPPLLR